MIKTLQATVDAANKREEALMQERDNLKAEIDLLRKKLFGSSSEKTPADFPGQLKLFNEAEKEQDPVAAQAEEMDAVLPPKKRKSRATNAERFKGIPATKEYLDLPEEEREEGTMVTTVYGVQKGCAFVRVHDVEKNKRAIRMTRALMREHEV